MTEESPSQHHSSLGLFRAESTSATKKHQKRAGGLAIFIVALFSISALGPYIVGSIRTEQFAIYGAALITLPLMISNLRLGGALSVLVPWALYIVVALLGVVFPLTIPARWPPGDVLAGIDNILAPIAVMLVIWSVVPTTSADYLLKACARIIAIAMALNGLLAITATRIDLSSILRPFWSNASNDATTAELASQMGRYSGIFNQPAEAGALYGIAGLLAVYVFRKRPVILMLLLTPIVVGGLISVSKIFIFGGLPLILFYWWRSGSTGNKGKVLFGIGAIALGILQSGLLDAWVGANYLARLFNPSNGQSALDLYTAGRTDADSSVAVMVAEALRVSPLTGAGAGGWKAAYDSAISESIAVAGLLGWLLQLCVLIGIFCVAYRTLARERRIFAMLLTLLIAGASLGFSPLTANRVSTVLWLIVSLLVLARRNDVGVPGLSGDIK